MTKRDSYNEEFKRDAINLNEKHGVNIAAKNHLRYTYSNRKTGVII